MKVTILFGSKSDIPIMKKATDVLKDFGVEFNSYCVSAHRASDLLSEIIKKEEAEGSEVFIAGAGLSAALPGVVASQTVLPVVGVPLDGGKLASYDSLLSVVQMPKQIPVATVGIDNAANAAYLACQILSIKYPELKTKIQSFRAQLQEEIRADLNPRVLG